MLHQRTQRIHRCDPIPTGLFYIIIPYLHIFMPIVQKNRFRKLCSPELIMSIGIACCNSPAADPVHEASFYDDIPIPCHTCPLLTFRAKRCHIDSTIVHVLIVDIPMDIMDPQIPKRDAAPHPFVLSHHCHTGTVHFLIQAITLSQNPAAFIRDLQILDHNVLCIIQKHCGRYIAVIHMRRGIQRCPIILIPDALSAGIDPRRCICGAVRSDHNRCLFRTTVCHMQILSIKYTAPL